MMIKTTLACLAVGLLVALFARAGTKEDGMIGNPSCGKNPGHVGHGTPLTPERLQDDGFALAGQVREVTDTAVRQVVRARVLAERDGTVWPSFDEDVIFELGIERALLTLTKADGPFPAGPTIWREGNRPGT